MPRGSDPPGDDGEVAKVGRSSDSGSGPQPPSGARSAEDSSSGYTSGPGGDPAAATRNVPMADVKAMVNKPVQPAATPDDPHLGKLIAGRYRVQEQLGRGGMGFVYKAEQQPLGRPVALKVMNTAYASARDQEWEQRFFLEAATAARIAHPNVITVYDHGKDGDTFYIAMEFLSGRTLARALAEDGPFPAERALHVASQVAKGVRAAHQSGAIHRDLKPANVMLIDHNDDRDFVKVLDFGLVKVLKKEDIPDLTMTGIFLGSPKYMSPEQIRNQDPDARADIYSLGVMLFQMATGRAPYVNEQPVNIMLAHLHDPVPVPSQVAPGAGIHPAMDALIVRCMQKDRTLRPASMDELLGAIKAVRQEVAGSASASQSGTQAALHPVAGLPAAVSNPPTETGAVSLSAMAPAPVATLAPRAPRTNLLMGMGAAVAAAVASIGLLTVLTREPAPTVAPPPPAPAAAPAVVPAPPPAAPRVVPLMINSEPPGAAAWSGDTLLGTTPLLVDIPPPPGERVDLVLRREGFEDLRASAELVNGTYRLQATLVPRPAATPPRNARPAKDKRKPRSSSSEFKDDPY